MIPPFDEHGNLPPGVHWATWDDLTNRYGIDNHRVQLLRRLQHVLSAFRDAGCETAFVDGSYVTAAELPQDIDVVWDVRGVNFSRLDPVLLERGKRLNQRALYSCELFPSDIVESSSDKPFVDFFQMDIEGPDQGNRCNRPSGVTMIHSERQYQVTRLQADRLRQALEALPVDPQERPMVDVRLQQAERDGISDLLDELRGQIDEYEMLQSGQRTLASIKYLEELPYLLVSARIAAGLKPSDLATRLEIAEDELLELERTAYASAQLPLITRTMDALGIRLRDGITLSYSVDEGWIASERAALKAGTSISE